MKERQRDTKEYLDYCLEKYYQKLLDKYGFVLIDTQLSGMGALYSFKNDSFVFTIINDRGVIETRIKSINSGDSYFDFDTLNVLMKKLKGEINSSDKSVLRNYLTKRLNLEDESELFDREMDFIKELFDKKNFKRTEKALNEIGKERAEFLFGKQ